MLIDSQQIHHPDKPEDDVQAVTDAPCCLVGVRMQTHYQSSQEEEDGNEIWYVPVLWEPNLQLLTQLPRFGHQYLIERYIFLSIKLRFLCTVLFTNYLYCISYCMWHFLSNDLMVETRIINAYTSGHKQPKREENGTGLSSGSLTSLVFSTAVDEMYAITIHSWTLGWSPIFTRMT